MNKRYILAIDQGTTSSRSLLVSKEGTISFIAQEEFEQIFPQSGWVEHNPDAIWKSQLKTIKECIDFANKNGDTVEGIGITNQRETTIIWDRNTGQAIYNAIVWQDRRTDEYCQSLKTAGYAESVHQKTGLFIDAYFSASKIGWILDNVEGARERAIKGDLAFGTVDSWLIWNLTKGQVHATDVSNASRTMLFNISSLQWDDSLLELFDIPKLLLPSVLESATHFGKSASEFTGNELIIGAAIGDQQAALFGQMCTELGHMKNTYGTGCFLVMNTGEQIVYSKHQLLTTVAWQINGKVQYALEGSIFIGGAIIQWLRDGLGIIKQARDVESLAHSVEDTGGIVLVPAFAGLAAPYWDGQARGTIFGITRGTQKAHIARAALESIALQVYDVVRAMSKDLGAEIKSLKVDGGACVNDELMQLQSDLLKAEVIRPVNHETTALGAAYLAGLTTRFWPDIETIKSLWLVDATFHPGMEDEKIKNKLYWWHKAVERSKNWL